MSKKITVWMDKDGLPLDDVMHYPATAKHLGSYEQVAEDLYRFRAPTLLGRASPEGQVHRMTHDYSHAATPGDVVHLPNQAPLLLTEPVRENTRLRSMQGMTP